MLTRLPSRITALLFLLWLCQTALGQKLPAVYQSKQDSLGIRVYTLEKVRVIATRPQESIGRLSVLNPGERTQALSGSVKEVLQDSPGLSVTTGTKDESNLRIRGFRKNEVKILVDGRPLNAGYFGNIDLQNLPLSDISEIQILKGPVSSLYGSNTMGGVVNLITREPSAQKWVKLGLLAKRNNTNQLELSVAHSFEDWNFWLYGSREHTDGFVLPGDFVPTISENGDVRNNSLKTEYNIQAKSSFSIMDFHTLGVSWGWTFVPEKKIPASIYEANDFKLYKDWARYQSTVMGDILLGEELKLAGLLYLDGGKDTYQQYNDPQYQFLSVNSIMHYNTVGANLKLELPQNGSLGITGGYNLDCQNSTRKDNGDYLNWTNHRIYLQHLFAQARQDFSARLNLTGSMGLSLATGDYRKAYYLYPEPALGIFYELPDQTRLSLATGINASYPTMRQLFSAERGNPNLKPQSGIKTELSTSRPFIMSNLSGFLELILFHNKVRNLIDLRDEHYTNIYSVDSYGFDAEGSIRPISLISFDAAYGYLDYSAGSDYRLTESPRNTLSLKCNLNLPHKLGLTISSLYKDIRFSQDSAGSYRVLPAYWSHSIYLNRDFGAISIHCGVDNIMDIYFEEEYGYPAAGRNFGIKLEAEI